MPLGLMCQLPELLVMVCELAWLRAGACESHSPLLRVEACESHSLWLKVEACESHSPSLKVGA